MAAESPALRSAGRPQKDRRGHQPDASKGRGGDQPHRPLPVALGQRIGGAAADQDLDSALGKKPGRRTFLKDSPASGSRQAETPRAQQAAGTRRSTYLGGDIKVARLGRAGGRATISERAPEPRCRASS